MMSTSTADIGAHSELLAAAWLMERGWHVFRNLSPTGPIDIVAVHPNGEVRKYDVKTWRRMSGNPKTGAPQRSQQQIELGVRLLLVHSSSLITEVE